VGASISAVFVTTMSYQSHTVLARQNMLWKKSFFTIKMVLAASFFVDLLVNGNLKYLEQLCGLIVSSNINIDWTAQAVIRKGMNASLLQKLRDSGMRFTCIWGGEFLR